MFRRTPLAVLTASLPLLVVACGGSETKQAAPPSTTGAAPAAAAPAGGTGSITGKVTYAGAVPPAEKVKTSADPKCAAMHKDGLEKQPIMVKDGGLANAFVYLKSGVTGTYPAPTTPVLLDQQGARTPTSRSRSARTSRSATATTRSTTSTRGRPSTPSSTSGRRARAWRPPASSTRKRS